MLGVLRSSGPKNGKNFIMEIRHEKSSYKAYDHLSCLFIYSRCCVIASYHCQIAHGSRNRKNELSTREEPYRMGSAVRAVRQENRQGDRGKISNLRITVRAWYRHRRNRILPDLSLPSRSKDTGGIFSAAAFNGSVRRSSQKQGIFPKRHSY